MVRLFLVSMGLTVLCSSLVLAPGCSTGVEDSPQPGVFRVTIHSDPADTSIIIILDTVTVSGTDSIDLTVFQGKLWSGARFATLFRSTTSYRQEDAVYNILRKENGEFRRYTVYESFVPPGQYSALQVGITATQLKFRGLPPIPVQLHPDSSLIWTHPFGRDISVSENKVTEINLEISPLASLRRYRDLYYFTRVVRVTGVRYY